YPAYHLEFGVGHPRPAARRPFGCGDAPAHTQLSQPTPDPTGIPRRPASRVDLQRASENRHTVVSLADSYFRPASVLQRRGQGERTGAAFEAADCRPKIGRVAGGETAGVGGGSNNRGYRRVTIGQ